VVIGKNTLLVEREDPGHIELPIDDAIPKNFFHHFLFRGLAVSATNEVALLDLGNWFAVLVVLALVALGLRFVRSALLGDHVSIFSQESVEERPAAITAFVEIVAHHEVLWGKNWHLLSIALLKSRLNYLGE